jgi:GxxExxY protein
MGKIIHKDLSYAVKGVLFHVHNALGPSLPERFYQAAVAMGLEAEGVRVETEKAFEVYYHGTRVGLYCGSLD